MKVLLCVLAISSLLMNSTSGVYTSLTLYSNEEKKEKEAPVTKIIILGDQPVTEDTCDTAISIDQQYAESIFEFIDRRAHDDHYAAFVLDSAYVDLDIFKKEYVDDCWNSYDDLHVGLRVQQATFAAMHPELKYENVHFYYANRQNTLAYFVNDLEILNQTVGLFKSKKTGVRLSLFDEDACVEACEELKCKLFASNYLSFVKKRFLAMASDICVEDFLNTLIALTKQDDSALPLLEKIKATAVLLPSAKNFVKGYENSAQTTIKDIVWDNFEHKNWTDFKRDIYGWMIPLFGYAQYLGIDSVLSMVVPRYKTVIVSCSEYNAKRIRFIMKKRFKTFKKIEDVQEIGTQELNIL